MKFKDYLTYQMPDSEFIHFTNFINFADFYFQGMQISHDWWEHKLNQNTEIREIKRSIQKRNVVLYCYGRTDALSNCFDVCKSRPSKTHVIILSRTDHPISQKIALSVPDNVTLLAHNVSYYHPNVIALPNGVKCYKDDNIKDWIGKYNIPNDFNFDNRKLLYCNFSIKNHKGYGTRNKIYKMLREHKWISFSHMGSFMEYKQSQQQYYKDTSQHKFTLSPSGGGIDTYRTWEAMYLKSIPIVQPNDHWKYFPDLPIIILDNYKRINKSFLEDKYQEMLERDINIEKITLSFWKNLIYKIVNRDT